MEEVIKDDLAWEHSQHTRFLKNCSTCFNEEKAHREMVRGMREDLGTSIGAKIAEDIIRNPNPLD